MKKKAEPFDDWRWISAAIALSKTLDYYADTESSTMNGPTNETTADEDRGDSDYENDSENRKLYDKAGRPTRRRPGQNPNNNENEEESNIVASNIKTIVVICSEFHRLSHFTEQIFFSCDDVDAVGGALYLGHFECLFLSIDRLSLVQ